MVRESFEENGRRAGMGKRKTKSPMEEGKDSKGGRTGVFREGWVRLQRRFARNVDAEGGVKREGRREDEKRMGTRLILRRGHVFRSQSNTLRER